MTRLVDDLLDASRALRDKVVLFPKKVEIGVVLANAIELSSALLSQRRHALTVDMPEASSCKSTSSGWQLFGKILSNVWRRCGRERRRGRGATRAAVASC